MTLRKFYVKYRGEEKVHTFNALNLPHLIFVHRELKCTEYIVYKDKKGTIELFRR